MAVSRKFVSIVIVFFIGLSVITIPDSYGAGNGRKKGKAAAYLETRPADYKTEIVAGSIVEIIEKGDRLFLKIDTNEKKPKWAAIPNTAEDLAIGDTVVLQPGMVMKNFHMKSLKMNFNRIVFSEGLAE